MDPNKWVMHRAGLVNFWYYDEETFDFADGKLLLRGSNGSGKSVTMQSFLPVLLDGKKTPDRLDPFGSRSRRMEDYLLGEKDVSNRDERTGYLFLEYKRKQTEQYITTGIGMQAKRNKQMKFWGFIIQDGRRIGHDVWLYKKEKQAKIPCSRLELEQIIGDGGCVVQSQKEYMDLVRKHVFGFDSLEAFDDLIKLLIQLRSPKLSKEFRPSVIHEILEAALPPLNDDDIRYLSDTIEQMDQTKQQIEQLDREVTALGKLIKAYDAYNERVLFDSIDGWKIAEASWKKEETERIQRKKIIAELEVRIAELERNERESSLQKEVWNDTLDRLRSHKVFSLDDDLAAQRKKQKKLEGDLRQLEERLEGMKRRERETEREIQLLDVQLDQEKRLIRDQLDQMEYEAEESAFTAHSMNAADFIRLIEEDFPFNNWKKETKDHEEVLRSVKQKLDKQQAITIKMTEKNRDISIAQQEKEQLSRDEAQWSRVVEEEKEKAINSLYEWADEHAYYPIEPSQFQEAARLIDDLYTTYPFEAIKQTIYPSVEQVDQQQMQVKAELQADIARLQKERDRLEQERTAWENTREPEPPRSDQTKQARQMLTEQGAAFAPFYEVVEFKQHVPPDVCQTIESALTDMGIIDALITEKPIHLAFDRVLHPNPHVAAHTLVDYIQPDRTQNKVSVPFIDSILRSIVMDDDSGESSMNEGGFYQIGLVKGHAIEHGAVKYIGSEARKRYKQEQIAKLEEELAAVQRAGAAAEQAIQQADESIRTSKKAWSVFPDDRHIREAYNAQMAAFHQLPRVQMHLEKMIDGYQQLDRDHQQVKAAVAKEAAPIKLERTVDAYDEALRYIRTYQDEVNQLALLYERSKATASRLAYYRNQLEATTEDALEKEGDRNAAEDQVSLSSKKIHQLERELEQAGAADIQQQLTEARQQLGKAEELLRKSIEEKPQVMANQEKEKEGLAANEQQMMFWSNVSEAYSELIRREAVSGFAGTEAEGKSTEEIVSLVETEKKLREKQTLESNLTRIIYEVQSDLMEYRLHDRPSDRPAVNWTEAEQKHPIVEQWQQRSVRRVIELDLRGQRVNPYTLYRQLSAEQEVEKSRLNEQDKKLFEDILFNSIGTTLRGRIHRAEAWTSRMKKLMERGDSTSGITFSIKWKPRTAGADDQLDTKDLVDMLKKDTRLLKDEDIQRISTHFRSRIQAAKVRMEQSGDGETLLQILKEVLDYRKWFSFVLYFQRTNEPVRELTNHKFFTFSGGEKAMAMYIPLFTACYSRYQEAADTAPYIISLDEAFAGVDENNINKMFEIVEQLGFNYIMNSQVLWGDYESVRNLSICELVRPKNADYVTVIRYRWDGHVREEVAPDE